MKLLKMLTPPIKATVIASITFAALGMLPLSADDTTATWIGGSSGAALTAANWGLEKIEDCKGYFRITNTVTFTESGAGSFWYIASLTIENRSAVTFGARYWHNSGSTTEILDIGEGSSLNASYMIGGNTAKTFYRRGAGTLTTPSVGSNGNVWKEEYFEDGLSKASALYVTDLIDIAAPATLQLTATTGATQGNPVWNVNGVLDCNAKAIPSIAGISGSGLITNANNLTVNLLKPNLTFDGAIQGRLVIEPSANADPDAYMVIGNAQTLANAELVVRDVEGHGDPIRFAAGIGTFYVRRFDKGRAYRDTEGNPVTLVESRMHLYVDSSRQGDPGDGLSWPTAYQTLKEAMESPSLDPLGTIVHVAEGTYSNGVMESGADVFRVIVPDNVELRSEAGAEKTFIVGAESPTPTSYGCGPGAIRCLKMAQSSRIEGFTITGGRVTDYNSANGGGCSGNGTMVDCVISNNVASQGAAVVCGNDSSPTTFIRCRFVQNRSRALGSALFYSSVLYDCLFDGNLGNDTIYTGAGKVYAYNCTFGPNNDNNAIRTYGQNGNLAHAYNCVFLKTVRGSADTQTNILLHACLATQSLTDGAWADDDCTVTNITSVAEALAFAGLDEDLKPLVSGRGRTVDVGTNSFHTLPDFENVDWDIDHAQRIQGARIDLGAVELDPTRTFVDLSVSEGGVTVEGIGLGRTEIAKGASVTFTLRRTFTSERLCTGLFVNGEFVDFEDYPDGWRKTVVGTGVSSYLNVEAVYSSENVIYVDCGPKGDDGNKGYHPDCPRKTLVGAMTPTPPFGTIVRVAPGCYTNEPMDSVETSDPTRARVVVPAGVTLESLAGADETFIVGEPSPTPDDYGCGADAVRCVFLNSGAVLRGFTCTNGFTVCTGTSNNNGGGAKGGTVEDCVFTRCAAWRGGGAHGSICRRCRFVDNAAKQIGTHLNESYGAYDCVFTGAKRGGANVTLNVSPLVNCTFYGNGTGSSWPVLSISNTTLWPSTPSNLVNCVIFGYANNQPYYTSCLFDSNAANVSEENRGAGSVLLPGAGSEIGGLDAEGRPLKGSCVIDVGTNMTFAADRYGTLDAGGGQRVYNGRVDIGAYEYDWRTDFAADIARGRMRMTDASADVTESEDETVLLGDGDVVKLVWKDQGRKPTDRFFNFKVKDGTLTVRVNGEAVADFAENGEWKYADGAATDEIEFSFAGTGRAELLRSKADIGVLLIVR